MYLERRRRRWYALHDIPADAQAAIGRTRFVQSLETEDRRAAERRAAVLGVRWQSEIEQARTKNGDHIERDAMFWRKALNDASELQREVIGQMITDEARAKVDKAASRAGIVDERDPRFAELPEYAEAERFAAIATGKLMRLDEHLDEYLATLGNEAKTVDMKRSTIRKFCEEFRYLSDVQRKAVQRWVNKLATDGKKVATIRRALSELRGYWGYLLSIEVASENNVPFEKLSLPRALKNGKEDEREPFKSADVVRLHKAALAREDRSLADLIELGMWTGARIEELCALKVDKVHRDYIEIEDAKTAAGWRQVPIHSKLKETIGRLRRGCSNEFLLSDLSAPGKRRKSQANKYGDRSNAAGKRFGHLKTTLGFGDEHVFHSIRRTVATQLENAGVAEGVAADIIGHEKATMTYGLYSGGASLEVKRKAIEKLDYAVSG